MLQLSFVGVFIAIYCALKRVWWRHMLVFHCSSGFLLGVLQVVLAGRFLTGFIMLTCSHRVGEMGP